MLLQRQVSVLGLVVSEVQGKEPGTLGKVLFAGVLDGGFEQRRRFLSRASKSSPAPSAGKGGAADRLTARLGPAPLRQEPPARRSRHQAHTDHSSALGPAILPAGDAPP